MGATASICFICIPSATESSIINTTAAIVPAAINGVRLPRLLVHLSESEPKSGSMNRAKTLSIPIITPDQLCDIPNLSVSILGMMVS